VTNIHTWFAAWPPASSKLLSSNCTTQPVFCVWIWLSTAYIPPQKKICMFNEWFIHTFNSNVLDLAYSMPLFDTVIVLFDTNVIQTYTVYKL